MSIYSKSCWLGLFCALGLSMVGCGGGDGTTTPPPPAFDPSPAPRNDPYVPQAAGGIPPGLDIRGVAFNSRFIYVADVFQVICYTYDFIEVGRWSTDSTMGGAEIIAIDTIPRAPVYAAGAPITLPVSPYPERPVVLFDPNGTGYCQILPVDLNRSSTVEPGLNLNLQNWVDVWDIGNIVEDPFEDEGCEYLFIEAFDMHVDRFQNIWIYGWFSPQQHPTCPFFRDTGGSCYGYGLLTFQPFDDYQSTMNGSDNYIPVSMCEGDIGVDIRDLESQSVVGNQPFSGRPLGLFAFDSYFPLEVHDYLFESHWQFQGRTLGYDYVAAGLTFEVNIPLSLGGAATRFTIAPSHKGIIGNGPGSGPGSFWSFDRVFLDPDLDDGGPSGIFVDDKNQQIIVADPENQRLQVFEATPPYAFLNEITGLNEPSRARVDESGAVWVVDVNQVRQIGGGLADPGYGGIIVTVTDAETNSPVVNAKVLIAREFEFIRWEPDGRDFVLTNINGQAKMANLKVGAYNVSASKLGYDNTDFVQISIQADTDLASNFILYPQFFNPLGSLMGRVLDGGSGFPLPNVEIRLLGTSLVTMTDDFGRFVLTEIAPKDSDPYQVQFEFLDPDNRFDVEYKIVTVDVQIFGGIRFNMNNVLLPRAE